MSESKALAATPRASSATTNAQAKNNNYKLVTSSSELQQAINSGVAGINIDRSIDASNVNLAITNTFAIVGINDAAVLNLGQKSLNNSGNLTLQDILSMVLFLVMVLLTLRVMLLLMSMKITHLLKVQQLMQLMQL